MPSLLLASLLMVTNQEVQPPGIDALARGRDVISALTAGRFPAIEARFTTAMKAALPSGRLETMWTSLNAQFGPHESCAADSRVRAIADKQMVITACRFRRATIDVQFAFDREGRISGMTFRPVAVPPPPSYAVPSYANPSSYTEEELTIGGPEWALPATLTMPAGPGPFPAVVLVHGSGPHDRDESIGANRPFKDLALGLASRGIAVLRYDKRSKVHRGTMASKPITVRHEVVDDAGEAVKALRAQARIDRARLFVLGHSLGGMLIPRIVAANPSVAGAIVLAGPARPIGEVIMEQARYIAMLDGSITPDEQTAIDTATRNAVALRALRPADGASAAIIAGAPASYWLDLRDYDPAAAAAALKVKLLVLQGERDFQVTMTDFARWKRALGSRADVTLRSYPALNHLFIAGSGPGSPQEYQTASHVAEDVIRDIASWIRRDGPR